MIIIDTDIFGAVLAFCIGTVIAAVNYALSRYVMKKHSDKYSVTVIVRQVIQITYLVLLFFFGEYTPWDRMWLLVGGCLGITIPMIWFTIRLVKLNDSLNRKEDSSDG